MYTVCFESASRGLMFCNENFEFSTPEEAMPAMNLRDTLEVVKYLLQEGSSQVTVKPAK